jgi:hypothetical protein
MSYAGMETLSGNDPSTSLGMELSAKRWNMEILKQPLKQYCPEEILNQVQNDNLVVQDDSY